MLYKIILNKYAGGSNAAAVWPKVEAELIRLKINYQLSVSKYSGHAELLALETTRLSNRDTRIIVIGGDGTLHEVINGLAKAYASNLHNAIPVGYIPAGTGNDFAKATGLSLNPIQALKSIIAVEKPVMTNIATYQEALHHEQGYFVNNLGIGLDASVVSKTNTSSSKKFLNRLHLGSFAYMLSILGVLLDQDSFQLTVHQGDHYDTYQHAFLVTTSNHPYFGGGIPILPTANIFDANLELIVIEKKSLLTMLGIALKLKSGKHLKSKHVHHYQAHQLHIATSTLEFGQIDGEELGSRFFDLTMTSVQYPFLIAAK